MSEFARQHAEWEQSRCWEQDGRCITAKDAQQVVAAYRAAYTTNRFLNLMLAATRHGHREECNAVFQEAIDALGR